MTSNLSQTLSHLEPEDLASPVDWKIQNGYNMYAFYPPVMYQYPRGLLLYTKGEIDRMQMTYKTHEKTEIPKDSEIFPAKTVWPPKVETKFKLSPEMEKKIRGMKFEDIRNMYPFDANAPASPFMNKRLISMSHEASWECDETKGQTDEQILATLGYPTVISRDQKQWKKTKFPALHSDGYHCIHPSWYYQPSTHIKYENLNKRTCTVKNLKKR